MMTDILKIYYKDFNDLTDKIDKDGRELIQIIGLQKPTPFQKLHTAIIIFRSYEKEKNNKTD